MERVGARDVDELVLRAYGGAGAAPDSGDSRAPGDPGAVSAARLANTERYLELLRASARYARAANSRPPRKIGSRLELFDCITCDKCVPSAPTTRTSRSSCRRPTCRSSTCGWRAAGERATLRGSGFELRFLTRDPLGTLAGEARGEVDLTYYWILRWVRDAVYAPGQLSYPALLARPDA